MGIRAFDLDWPADRLDDEEQDEPLAGRDHSLTIQNVCYALYTRLRRQVEGRG